MNHVKNPFPGMNPWLEESWRDVHASLLVYARDQLNSELPPGLRARVDERVGIDIGEDKVRAYLPDVAITEPWDRPVGPVLGRGGVATTVAEPIIVDLSQEILRHIEIVDSRSHIITAIELLSPSNKADTDAVSGWHRKRADYLRGGINIVEIDLLRGGFWVLPNRAMLKPVSSERIYHYVCVTRLPWSGRHEFYVLALRERLPAIRVPLRRTDPDVALDLQALVDQCYEHGRYGTELDFTKPPLPPLPAEEVAWMREVLGDKS